MWRYKVELTSQELTIIQHALNAYSRATSEPAQEITEVFEYLSDDQERYTISQVRLLARSIQSNYTEIEE